ncbi:MAG: kinase/pyrophosphorylase [Proteobacteria bacterium]|nr:kinase/pyrophosphorylase [Pseudomonadota bacterium]MCZ6893736.1 kinase/pyrophosphorylase [Gammaproteobacteria bacterium]
MTKFNLHLVSDATGETLQMVARAAITQFEEAAPVEHVWSMIRTAKQLDPAIEAIKENPGIVLYTLVSQELRQVLKAACRRLDVPCVDILVPAIDSLRQFLHTESRNQPGRQHVLDDEYFERIEAMNFTLAHDDGQALYDLVSADIVLVGVSRTSKTPTSMYLANRGVKIANVPIVPGQAIQEELETLKGPLIVALTTNVKRLVQIRRNRMKLMRDERESDYVDEDAVKTEVAAARRFFARQRWPIIDVTGRSIEETAATVLKLYAAHNA